MFVRIKEKNLHVDCFKCSTCGSSLKNVGESPVFFFSVNISILFDFCEYFGSA